MKIPRLICKHVELYVMKLVWNMYNVENVIIHVWDGFGKILVELEMKNYGSIKFWAKPSGMSQKPSKRFGQGQGQGRIVGQRVKPSGRSVLTFWKVFTFFTN